MRAVELIVKKRAGLELSEDEIRFLVKNYVDGTVPDYQMAAWTMAVYFKGMTFAETGFLTRAMIDSGSVLSWPDVARPLVDKHSTGGVGDKISLILAPLAAACGLRVPMMSGRALGHTGGTLDKLESISGFRTDLPIDALNATLRQCNYVMTGQSQEIVPADRLLYSLRDVSGTVESIPLITASILSKKFAEGADALVFDVKCGRGAFMETHGQALALASSLVETARSLDRKAVAILTDMSQPLGRMTGNFLEVEESITCLRGKGPDDLLTLVYRQTAWMLVAAGLAATVAEGELIAQQKLADGSALAKWEENVALQGGDVDLLNQQWGHRRAPWSGELTASSSGWHGGWDALECGLTATALGAGRNRKEDRVKPNVGLEFLAKRGERVAAGDAVLRVWAESEAEGLAALSRLKSAWTLSPARPSFQPLILDEVQAL